MAEMTDLLRSMQAGDSRASNRLFELVYADLKRLAHARLYRSGNAGELDTTALVHECFLRMVAVGQLRTTDRHMFFGYVARVMRSVVVDHARAQQASRRGGDGVFVTLTTDVPGGETFDDERLLAMDSALDMLERVAPKYRQLVELRYFTGLSVREVAEMRGSSPRTIEREWEKARAFLRKLMQEGPPPSCRQGAAGHAVARSRSG